MDNKMEHDMGNEIKTGILQWFVGIKVCTKWC